MKNLLHLILALALTMSIGNACTKENAQNEVYWGEVSATKNGLVSWKGQSRCIIDKPYEQGIDIIIYVLNEKKFKRENLNFFKIENKVGVYPIIPTDIRTIDSLHGSSYGTLIDDGVGGDSYDLIEGIIENRFTIDKKEGDEIWGTFQVAFVKDKTYLPEDPTAPDTVVFTHGQFHTRLQKQ